MTSSRSSYMNEHQRAFNGFVIKKGDIIVLLILLIISIVPSFLFTKNISETTERYGFIYVSGEKYKEIKLGSDIEYEFEIDTELGHNIVIVSGYDIYMKEADCYDQTCVKQGTISEVSRSIVCLPNRVYIEIKGKEPSEIDDISR